MLGVVVELVAVIGGPTSPVVVVVEAPAPPDPMVLGVPVPPAVVTAAVTAAAAAAAAVSSDMRMGVVTTFVAVFRVGVELMLVVMVAACDTIPGAVAEVPGMGTTGLVVGVDVVVV